MPSNQYRWGGGGRPGAGDDRASSSGNLTGSLVAPQAVRCPAARPLPYPTAAPSVARWPADAQRSYRCLWRPAAGLWRRAPCCGRRALRRRLDSPPPALLRPAARRRPCAR
eukprot:scaffold34111_cov112-Isochrysis_galbana.AAC.2